MNMYKMPKNKPVCTLYAAAMVLGVEPGALAEEIGSDGLEVWWPNKGSPHCYRGIHIEELITPCLTRGYMMMNFSFYPMLASGPDVEPKPIYTPAEAAVRFNRIISLRLAIIFVHVGGVRHAVAWNGVSVYDPRGSVHELNDYLIEDAYVLFKIK